MKKPLLLLLLLVLLVLTVPELRSFAAPVIDPVGERIALAAQPAVEWVQAPFFEWKARDEARALLNIVREREAMGLRLPRPSEFQGFLDRRAPLGRNGLDPWGTPYYLKYTARDVIIGSAGADLQPDTEDDIQESFPRRLR